MAHDGSRPLSVVPSLLSRDLFQPAHRRPRPTGSPRGWNCGCTGAHRHGHVGVDLGGGDVGVAGIICTARKSGPALYPSVWRRRGVTCAGSRCRRSRRAVPPVGAASRSPGGEATAAAVGEQLPA